jgi:membrane protease YdiL (CAAX protease family)
MPVAVIIFQIIIVLLVPLLSIANLQMMDKIKEAMLPEKKKLYFQSAMNQIVLTIIALWAADASEITISYIGSINSLALIGAGVFLAIAFTVGYISNKRKDIEEKNPGLELLKPNTISEKWSWVVVNLVAATCEEIIFRGVLFQLFFRTTHNMLAAGIMSAITFGFSHSVQGVWGIVVTAVFGLGLQHLVYLNNGLLIAMVVHFIYNMGTTFIILEKKREALHNEIEEDATF